MTSPQDPSIKAFPSKRTKEGALSELNRGMDLRDYFAAGALAAMSDERVYNPQGTSQTEHFKKVAEVCYLMADAMIKVREAE
ncbi:MAG: hypothetical protein ABJH63_12480 [Rhizobiaceae bacterium]